MLRALFSFGFLQALNFLTPILLVAILSRSESKDAMMVYLMMQSVSSFMAIAVEYGFYLSAIRRVAIARKFGTAGHACTLINSSKVLIYCFLIIFVLVDALVFRRYSAEIYIGILIAVFSIGMRPLWYYQGSNFYKEMIQGETIAVLATLLLILLVLGKGLSGEYLFILSFIPRFVITFYLLCCISMREGLVRVNFLSVLIVLKESFLLFFHRVAAGVLHYAVPIFIGLIFTSIELFAYQKADRLFYLFQSVSLIFSQVAFARLITVVHLLKRDRLAAIIIQVFVSVVFAIALYAGAPYILMIYYGDKSLDSIALLEYFSFIIPIMGLNAAIGLSYFVVENEDYIVVCTAAMGAIATVLMLWINPFKHGLLLGVYSILLGEVVILIGMLYFLFVKIVKVKNL